MSFSSLSIHSNPSYEFLFFEIQEILAANDKIFPEGNSQSAIFDGKRLAVVAKSLEYHEDKLITQVNKEWDESLQEYGANLLEEVRKKYSEKWNSSWKYDAFLGYAYDIILKYDERYAAYKNAADKVDPQPPELLVALAGCCWAPGKPPITEEEAISLVKQAIASVQYIEAVELLRGLYKSTGNVKEEQYFEKILKDTKDTGPHLPSLELGI